MPGLATFTRLTLLATLLALAVVVMGAWVRLSDAGLGCPDWPGCYGHLSAPRTPEAVRVANLTWPAHPVETDKALREMSHRYLAGALGLCLLAIAALAWRRRRMPGQRLGLPAALLGLGVVEALLGMGTVRLLLEPLVVSAHLLGGMLVLLLLWWLALRQGRLFTGYVGAARADTEGALRRWVALGVGVVLVQIWLGAWTSSNHAALACHDLPRCQGSWWPPMDFAAGFDPWRGGIEAVQALSQPARTAIHLVHRLGAVLTLLYIGWIAAQVVQRSSYLPAAAAATVMLVLVVAQAGLGAADVLYGDPLPLAVAHNAVAALLLLSVTTLYHLLKPPRAAL